MTKSQLNTAIEKVSTATNSTKEEVAKRLEDKDQWTWFLINQSK